MKLELLVTAVIISTVVSVPLAQNKLVRNPRQFVWPWQSAMGNQNGTGLPWLNSGSGSISNSGWLSGMNKTDTGFGVFPGVSQFNQGGWQSGMNKTGTGFGAFPGVSQFNQGGWQSQITNGTGMAGRPGMSQCQNGGGGSAWQSQISNGTSGFFSGMGLFPSFGQNQPVQSQSSSSTLESSTSQQSTPTTDKTTLSTEESTSSPVDQNSSLLVELKH